MTDIFDAISKRDDAWDGGNFPDPEKFIEAAGDRRWLRLEVERLRDALQYIGELCTHTVHVEDCPACLALAALGRRRPRAR